jgi:alpha-beta hydrolase superfamily lysophospholipase
VGDSKPLLTLSPDLSNMTPVTFQGRLGWLHMPVGRNSGVGVVLVSALGRDGRCGYMPMRLFADQLAAAGFPTLRYDHLGTGDSLDLPDAGGDALPYWLEGIEQAAELLRTHAAARRVILGGARTGATLAAISPLPVDGLILLAPVLGGRSWLRRLRFSAGVTKKTEAGGEPPLDTEGLWLSPATVSSLSQVDLAKAPPPRPAIFLASQNKPVGDYAAGLADAGAAIVTTDFPGFSEFYLETTVNEPPQQVFDRARHWLIETFDPHRAAIAPASGAEVAAATQHPPAAVEHVVSFGEGLRGVLCEPAGGRSDSPAVLFCNTGGDPRAGAGGFATGAARRLAARGLTSLRFDFAGIGDSPAHGDELRSHVFETPREADADAAVNFLAERGHEVVVVGTCSGAYHALRTAWRNPTVTGVFAVSPIKVLWRPGDSVSFARDEYLYALQSYISALFKPDAWKLILQNEVGIGGLLLALGNRLRSRVIGRISRSLADSPLAKTKRFVKRGGRAGLIMGVNDTSLEEIGTFFGAEGKELKRLPRVTMEVIANLDHGLTLKASRETAMNRLETWLKASS